MWVWRLHINDVSDKLRGFAHREPAANVSDEEERVVFEVAHHGVAATQLRGPPIPLVVVADGAVTDHSQNVREDPLVVTEERDEKV